MRHLAGVLKHGTISLDGTKVHADASKRKAVSYKRLLEWETQLRAEVEELFVLSEQPEVLDGLVVSKEIVRWQDRLVRRAVAKAVLEARAKERVIAERAEYEARLEQRKERERMTGRREGWSPTDPQSRIMKSPTHAGYAQDYNAQMEVDQARLLIVGCALSHRPNDRKARRTHVCGYSLGDWHS